MENRFQVPLKIDNLAQASRGFATGTHQNNGGARKSQRGGFDQALKIRPLNIHGLDYPLQLSSRNCKSSVRKADKITITKKNFVDKLSERLDIEPKLVNRIFLETLDLIVEELHEGNKLEFRGAFILGTKIQETRMAQNPKTLEKVEIPERRVVYFKKGDRLKVLE